MAEHHSACRYTKGVHLQQMNPKSCKRVLKFKNNPTVSKRDTYRQTDAVRSNSTIQPRPQNSPRPASLSVSHTHTPSMYIHFHTPGANIKPATPRQSIEVGFCNLDYRVAVFLLLVWQCYWYEWWSKFNLWTNVFDIYSSHRHMYKQKPIQHRTRGCMKLSHCTSFDRQGCKKSIHCKS